jgi:hypothetical protein
MKKCLFLLIAVIIIGIGSTKAQLANTSWKGTYKIPDPTELILQFKTDTLLLNDPVNGNIVETMNYKISGDTLTLIKISGSSSCNDEKGIYKISAKDDKLFLGLIEDSCYDRSSAMPDEPMVKVE